MQCWRDAYQEKGMFSKHMPEPAGANMHHMLWKYLLKCEVPGRLEWYAMADQDRAQSHLVIHILTVLMPLVKDSSGPL